MARKKLRDEDLVLNIIVNGDKGQKELADLDKTVKDLSADNKKLISRQKELSKAGKENTAEYKQLTAQIEKNDKAIQHANARMDQLRQGMDLSKMSARDLRQEQRKLRALMDTTQPNTPLWRQYQARLKKVDTQLAKTRGQLKATKFSLKNMADGFNRYFSLIAAGVASFTGVVLGARKAVDAANLREEVRDDLQALTGLVDSEVQILMDAASRMSTSQVEGGIRITQSADDIANAYKLMGSQRPELLKNSTALQNVTTDAMILAEASKGKLEPSVRALAAVMNQFNEPASESRNIINSMASGSQAGAGDIEYIGTAMEKAGTSAELMNVSYQQTIGVIESMAPYYTRAEMMGNSLDKVLLKLKDKQIGYASGTFEMNDAIDELREMYEAGTTAGEIFGVEHAKMGELLVLNQENFNMYTEMVTDSNKAIEQASINTDNNSAKLAQAKNRIRETSVVLGQKLQPAMTKIVSKGSMMLKMLVGLVDFLSQYGGVIIKTTIAIGGYVAAKKLFNIANSKGISSIKDLFSALKNQLTNLRSYTRSLRESTEAQKKLSASMKANFWSAVSGAITMALVALIKFIKQQREVKKAVDDTRGALLQQKTDMDSLFDTLERAPRSSDTYKDAMKRLNKEYGQYLSHQITEKTSIAELTQLRREATQALNEEMIAMLQQRLNEKNLDFYETLSKKQSKAIDDLIKRNFSREQAQEIVKEYTKYQQDVHNGISRAGDPWMERLSFDVDPDKVSTVYFELQKVNVALVELQNRTDDSRDAIQMFKDSLLDDVPEAQWLADLPENIAQYTEGSQARIKNFARQYTLLVAQANTEAEKQELINEYLVKRSELLNELSLKPVDNDTPITPTGEPGDHDSQTSKFEKQKQDQQNFINDSIEFQDKFWKDMLEKDHQALVDSSNMYEELLVQNSNYIDFYREQSLLGYEGAQENLEKHLQIQEDLTAAADQALIDIANKKENDDNQRFQIRKSLKLVSDKELYAAQLELYRDYLKQGIISQEEYNQLSNQLDVDLKAKRMNHYREMIDVVSQLSGNLYSAVTGMRDASLAKEETRYQEELKLAGDNADKREQIEAEHQAKQNDIRKRYADAEFVAKIAQMTADLAMGISSIWAKWSELPPVAIALTAGLTAAVLPQIAIANQERQRVKQLEKGNVFEVIGQDDGLSYDASFVPKLQTGIYSQPHLALFNENPSMPEMVIDGPTLQSIRINEPYILSAIQRNVVRQHADGLYPESADQSGVPVDPAMMALLIKAVQDSTNTNAMLAAEIQKGIGVSYDKIKNSESEMSNIYSKSSS